MLRQPEVENLEPAIRSYKQVCGLKISMDDPLVVRRSQAFRQLRRHANDLRLRHRTTKKSLAQGRSGNQFHCQKVHAFLRTELENRCNIRMTQLGERQRFFAELLSCDFVGQRTCRQHFERDIAVQLLVVRAIDDAHAARANLFDDAIMAETLANELGRRLHQSGNARTCGGQCPCRNKAISGLVSARRRKNFPRETDGGSGDKSLIRDNRNFASSQTPAYHA